MQQTANFPLANSVVTLDRANPTTLHGMINITIVPLDVHQFPTGQTGQLDPPELECSTTLLRSLHLTATALSIGLVAILLGVA